MSPPFGMSRGRQQEFFQELDCDKVHDVPEKHDHWNNSASCTKLDVLEVLVVKHVRNRCLDGCRYFCLSAWLSSLGPGIGRV